MFKLIYFLLLIGIFTVSFTACKVNPNVEALKEAIKPPVDPVDIIQGSYTFTGPQTETVNICMGPFILERDQVSSETEDLPIVIKGGELTSYYSDSACSSNIASLTFAQDDLSHEFYIKSNLAQSFFIITEFSETSFSIPVTLNPAVSHSIKVQGDSLLLAGECSNKLEISLIDSFQNVHIPSSNVDIAVSGLASGSMYSDSSCSNAISAITLLANQEKFTFYLKDNVKESFIADFASTGISTYSMGVIVISGPPKSLGLTIETSDLAGTCSSAGKVETFDILGNSTNVTKDETIALAETGQGKYYLTNDCSGASITSVVIANNTNQTTLYYKNQKAETTTLTASLTGITSSTVTRITNPEKATIINLNADLSLAGSDVGTAGGSMPFTANADECKGPLKLAIQDKHFNLSPLTASVNIDITNIYKLGNGRFYSDATCVTTQSPSITFTTGSSSIDLYYKGTREDLVTIVATTQTPLPGEFTAVTANSQATVVGLAPDHLQLAGPSFFFKDECTPPFTVYLRDKFDSSSDLPTDITVSLSNAVGSGAAYADASCSIPLTGNNLNITAGQTTGAFYLKSPSVEVIDQEITATGLTKAEYTISIINSLTTIDTFIGNLLPFGLAYYTTSTPTTGLTSQPFYSGYDVASNPLDSRFYRPGEMKSYDGYLYYPDRTGCVFFKIDPATWTRIIVAGQMQKCSYNDGVDSTTAQITSSMSGRFDINEAGDKIYFTDKYSIRVADLTTGGVSTLAGQYSSYGSTDAIGASARFYNPYGITKLGNDLYIADYSNRKIRKLNLTSLEVSTAVTTTATPNTVTNDGTDVYFFDNYALNKYDPATDTKTIVAGSYSTRGSTDAIGTAARFGAATSPYVPYHIVSDPTDENIYISDTFSSTVRKFNIASAQVTTIVGTYNTPGNHDDTGEDALFGAPYGLGFNNLGTKLYVLDGYEQTPSCGLNTSANYYRLCNLNLREVDLATRVTTTKMGPNYEHRTAGGRVGTRADTPVDVRYISTDGEYIYYDGYDNYIYSVKLGDDAPDAIKKTIYYSLIGDIRSVSSQQFFKGYYYYYSAGYIKRRAVTDGEFSTTEEDIAGSGSPLTPYTLVDGYGTDAVVYRPYFATIDPVTESYYFTDINGSNQCFLRKLDLNTGGVVTVKELGYRYSAPYNYLCGQANYQLRPVQVGNDWYFMYSRALHKMNLETGTITSNVAGSGSYGYIDGIGTAARFYDSYTSLCTDQKYIYMIDHSGLRRVRVDTGEVTTIGGNQNIYAQKDGALADSRFYHSVGSCAVNSEGLFINDYRGSIRKAF